MQSRAHVETDTANAFDDRARRTVERREEPVTGGVDFVPAKSLQLAPDDGMVALEEVSPRAVAERPRAVRRADDVGEHHGREHAVGVDRLTRARQELLD